jgi:hypothetical protein
VPGETCGEAADVSGVVLVDPAGGVPEVIIETAPTAQVFTWTVGNATSNERERLLARALAELDLEGCCGEPSHGSRSVSSGAVYEGADIFIGGGPTDAAPFRADFPPQRMSLGAGEAIIFQVESRETVAFTCGDTRWTLVWQGDGTAEVDSMLLLAEELLPHLYCALGPPPEVTSG